MRNVDFLRADVQVHDFGHGRFDAAYSRFGVMFFSDAVAAFANVHKALRPGGLLSLESWQGVFDNEWMLIPGAAVAPLARLRRMPTTRPGPELSLLLRKHSLPDCTTEK